MIPSASARRSLESLRCVFRCFLHRFDSSPSFARCSLAVASVDPSAQLFLGRRFARRAGELQAATWTRGRAMARRPTAVNASDDNDGGARAGERVNGALADWRRAFNDADDSSGDADDSSRALLSNAAAAAAFRLNVCVAAILPSSSSLPPSSSSPPSSLQSRRCRDCRHGKRRAVGGGRRVTMGDGGVAAAVCWASTSGADANVSGSIVCALVDAALDGGGGDNNAPRWRVVIKAARCL